MTGLSPRMPSDTTTPAPAAPANPRSRVITASLSGTTIGGGANGDGTVFRLRPSDLKYEVLASFDRATTGAFPEDNVVPAASGPTLYGLTQSGGVHDPTASNYFGTVFALDLE